MNINDDPFRITEEERQHFRITSELANAWHEIVWTAQPDGRVDYYNRHWFKYTGMTLDQSEGAGWMCAVHHDDRQSCVDVWEKALLSGDGFKIEFRLLRADGAFRWQLSQAAPVRNPDGKITKWFGICRDIEDQVCAQRTVQESHEKQIQQLSARVRELENLNAQLTNENMNLKQAVADRMLPRCSTADDN